MIQGNRRNAIVYNPDTYRIAPAATDSMLAFLNLLRQRYQSLVDHPSSAETGRREALLPLLGSLGFAEAYLEKTEWLKRRPQQPLQVAILGPTQSGKSSMMNWLSGSALAEVSPLAGFTVHPQGFALFPENSDFADDLDAYFHGYRRLPRASLNHEQLNGYALEWAPSDSRQPLKGAVIWDTPDFDSIQSGEYRNAVLRVAALADVVVLVLSKDKYADLSVWEFMRLLEPLAQPTLILLNKTDPETQPILLRSVEDKWRAFRGDPPPPVTAIPYLPQPGGLAGLADIRQAVMGNVGHALAAVQRQTYPEQARRLLKTHWPAWSAPLLTEHRLQQEWQNRLDAVIEECIDRYQRDYLDHPVHYETFQRALAELLTLLEIPGLGGALQTARQVITWPVRQLGKLGRIASGRTAQVEGEEPAILHQIAEHALIRISEGLLFDPTTDPFERRWLGLINQRVSEQRTLILSEFDDATRAYILAFQPEIDQTAHGLYEHLQEHPVVLNSLRATRVTTDAAALAMALHTGGIGVQDVVIAPAMLAVTSLLAESALGRYMEKAAALLRQRQKESVTALLNHALRERLAPIPEQIDPALRLGIPAESLAAAARQLD